MGDDGDRWRRAFESEQQRMWRSLLAFTRDPDIAADAVAEAFAQGLRRGGEIRDPAAWAWRSAFRIAGGILADQSRHATAETAVDAAALPDDVVALLDALSRLSDDDRRIVVLALVGGFGASEIGALVEARPGAVRVRLHRARARLRAELTDDRRPRADDLGPGETRPSMGGAL